MEIKDIQHLMGQHRDRKHPHISFYKYPLAPSQGDKIPFG
jgi:hypothetical protein